LKVAAVAGQRKVARVVGATVLSRDDVFHVMGYSADALMKPTVLTSIISQGLDKPAGGVHPTCLLRDAGQMSPRFQPENRDEVGGVHQRLVFGPLLGVEESFVCAPGQAMHTGLNGLINSKYHKPTSRLSVKTKAQRFQEAVKPCDRGHVLNLPRKAKLPVALTRRGVRGTGWGR
jgi:hypothetical protein